MCSSSRSRSDSGSRRHSRGRDRSFGGNGGFGGGGGGGLFEPQLGDPSVATGNRSVTLSPAAYSSTWLNARTGARLATNVEAHKVGRLNN